MAVDSATAENRKRLFAAFEQDRSEENRNAIVESYLPLAEFFAGRYSDRGASADDLRQVAKLALVTAVDRFDPTVSAPSPTSFSTPSSTSFSTPSPTSFSTPSPTSFSTFAGRTIDGELKKYFRDKTWAVRVPRALQERSLLVRKMVDELTVSEGRSPTPEKLAAATGLDLDDVLEALDVQRTTRTASIHESAEAGGGSGTPSASPRALPVSEAGFAETEVRLAVRRLLATVPEREQEILRLRFFEELSQEEIAEAVGVSQMHVSRLLRSALESMRAQLEVDPGD